MSLRTWLLGKLLREDEKVVVDTPCIPDAKGGGASEEIKKSERVKKNIYLRCGRYNINAHSTGWGTVDTLAQAEYVLEYLEFNGFPKKLSTMNLVKSKKKKSNEYYNAIRRLARKDKKWLERNK